MISTPKKSSRSGAFTLIELLTVIAIIGILAAIIIPTVGAVRKTAQASVCLSNLRQVGLAAIAYANDNKDALPDAGTGQDPAWARSLASYMSMPAAQKSTIFVCPGADLPVSDAVNQTDIVLTYGMHAGLMPRGGKAISLSKIKRPSDVILAADMCQDPNNNNWSPNSIENPNEFLFKPGDTGGRGGGSIDLNAFISTATDNDTGNNAWIRYRHNGKANVARCDGSAASFAKGAIQKRHVIYYE